MSDEDEIERVATRDDDDDDRYGDDISPKKIKKKKKSSSKKERSSSSSSSTIAGSTSRVTTLLAEYSQKVRGVLFSATNLSNTSRRATMVRVLFLVVMACMVIGAGMNMSLNVEETTVAPAVETEPEEVIVQKLPGKKNNKFSTAMEKEFGCRELQCVAQCNGKAKPKCLKSKSCVSERDKICQKRCRKARCEERCKDEPHLGYVEREQGLEKCKDSCTGPTATHNKCVVKCHVKYKPCKSRCHESANKFKCDNPKILAMVSQTPGASSGSSSSNDDEDDEGDSHGSGDADDEEDGGDAPPPKRKSGPALAGLDDGDLL